MLSFNQNDTCIPVSHQHDSQHNLSIIYTEWAKSYHSLALALSQLREANTLQEKQKI